jgi:G6PDH family F420-dependent oxidoreductase
MTTFGYFLASEEHSPDELVRQAQMAEEAGFEALWISDHFHPWLDEQGESSFVWSVIGALSQATSLPVTTAVTCPLVRIHPVIIAQAAATSQLMLNGRFRLGVGTGEALNEHVIESRWPPAAQRLEMLEEAVGLIRRLFTGELVTHRGEHYHVDTARLYSLPDEPPPIYMSGFGDTAARLAGRLADGFMCTMPDADLVRTFHNSGGLSRPVQGAVKVCWGAEQMEAAQLLPLPRHFAQLTELVTCEAVADAIPCGPDPETHARAVRTYVDAGYDEVYINQIGPEQEPFFAFYHDEVLPRLRSATG